jgi:hypothetical protein
LAGISQLIDLGFGTRQPGDLEKFGVLERGQNRAGEIVALLHQHRGRQIARHGVDGVTEQHQLHERDHDDHRERHAVAPQLDEFLQQHRPGLAPEAVARQSTRRLRGDEMGHW